MANKRIILLSDGTGNSAGKVWRTNVWRVFESLDLTRFDARRRKELGIAHIPEDRLRRGLRSGFATEASAPEVQSSSAPAREGEQRERLA